METLGAQIRLARLALGYSQKDVADHVGTGQQAVSGWERDEAIPEDSRLNLLRAVLDAPLLPLPKRTPEKTVEMRCLPLKQLDQRQFIGLIKTLMDSIYSGSEFRTYPDAGAGIHFKVITPHGDHLGFRCVSSQKFHPSSLDKAVRHTAQCADEYTLLLNVPVSTKVREREKQIESWRIWDAHDISDLLLQAPASTLNDVMDLYFPGLRITRPQNGKPIIVVQPAGIVGEGPTTALLAGSSSRNEREFVRRMNKHYVEFLVSTHPDIIADLRERFELDGSYGIVEYAYSLGLFPPGYEPGQSHSITEYSPPGHDGPGFLVWTVGLWSPSADGEADSDQGDATVLLAGSSSRNERKAW